LDLGERIANSPATSPTAENPGATIWDEIGHVLTSIRRRAPFELQRVIDDGAKLDKPFLVIKADQLVLLAGCGQPS
jgi:hypothetical protein